MSDCDNMRRHRSQMTPAEIAAVEAVVHRQHPLNWHIGPHATNKMKVTGVVFNQVIDVLGTGYVVEVNQNNDLCALFRKDYGHFSVCIVINLPTMFVVSVWKNSARDNHATLDHSKYLWNENIETVMAAFA